MRRFICTVVFGLLTLSFAQNMPILYDSRLGPTLDSKFELTVQTQIAKEAAQVQQKACGAKPVGKGNLDDFFIKFSGSFTRAQANQAVYFISSCRIADKQGLYLSLFENQKMLNLYQIIVPGRFVEAYGVNDVNQNGQREIAMIYDWADGCDGVCTFRTLDLLEFKASEPIVSTSLIVERGGSVKGSHRFIYTVYVLKGKDPVFVGVRNTETTTLTALKDAGTLAQIIKLK